MTITTEDIISGGHAGNGSTDEFSTPHFQRNADIRALLVTNATGAETLWVLDTDYTLTGAGNPPGGTLIATTPHPTGTTLYITVDPPQTQEAINPGAAATEDALDKLTQLVLQMGLRVDRSFKLPEADRLAGPVSTTIPAGLASDRALNVFGFDGSGVFGALDFFGAPDTPISSSTTYDPLDAHFGRHLLFDVENGSVALTLPDATPFKAGTGFFVSCNSDNNTPSFVAEVPGQIRSRPLNGITGHNTTADTVYLGYSPDVQASSLALCYKDTTTGGTPHVWRIFGMIRDGVADDNQITPGGGGGGSGGPGAVDSVVGQTGDVTANQIKTAVAALSDTNFATDAQVTKLTGIETAATADQTGAEIKTLYEAESDTNAFTDARAAKLDGITLGTDPNNVVQLDGSARLPAVDGSQLTNLAADVSGNFSAKGSLLAGTGSSTFDEFVAGNDGEVPTYDSGETTGLAKRDVVTLDSADAINRNEIDYTNDRIPLDDDSASAIKKLAPGELVDPIVSRPTGSFTISAADWGTLFILQSGAEAGGTVNEMRDGQVIAGINKSGSTVALSAGTNVTLDPSSPSIGDGLSFVLINDKPSTQSLVKVVVEVEPA